MPLIAIKAGLRPALIALPALLVAVWIGVTVRSRVRRRRRYSRPG